MKNSITETSTLEWLLEKYGQDSNGTIEIDDNILNIKDIYCSERCENLTDDIVMDGDNNLFNKSSDFTYEQKKANVANKQISENFSTMFKNLSQKNLRPNSTYYKNIYEYNGVVESVDKILNKFTAILVNTMNAEDILSAEFGIDEIGYSSEQKLIDVGLKFVWIIGQESQLVIRNGQLIEGTIQNMSKFIIRRPQILNNKKIREANDKANRWAEFFRRLESSDTNSR